MDKGHGPLHDMLENVTDTEAGVTVIGKREGGEVTPRRLFIVSAT